MSSGRDNTDIVKLLLAHGADNSAKTLNGWTPLMWAAQWGKPEAIIALIESGADPNDDGGTGHHPIELAFGMGLDQVEVLYQHGASGIDSPNWQAFLRYRDSPQ